jgi:hypothetical protein
MCLTWLTVRKKGQNVRVWGTSQLFSRRAKMKCLDFQKMTDLSVQT